MILVSGGIKGGSGKTTLATNLTVMRAFVERRVLLVDADEQKSASHWAEQRENSGIETNWSTIRLEGNNLHKQIERLRDNYDDIIIDVGGRDTTSQRSALAIADIFLVPFKPRSFDIWTIGPLNSLISQMKNANKDLNVIAVINQADTKGEDNNAALEVLSECTDIKCCPVNIVHRKAFANAASSGQSVVEMKVQDKKAVQEMISLYKFIYNGHIHGIHEKGIKDMLNE